MKLITIKLALIALVVTSLNAQAARYVRYDANGTTAYGEVVGETVHELSGHFLDGASRTGVKHSLDSVNLLMPLDPKDVSKILGTAVNTKRPNLKLPEDPHPRWFAKFPSSLNHSGGGVMLQHMPKASPSVSGEGGSGDEGLLAAEDLVHGDDEENWNRVNILLSSVEEMELIGPSVPPTELLVRLFHEEQPRVYDAQSVKFGCTCSEDRVRQSLSIYSAKDIEKMTNDDGRVTADCQFCGTHYDLDPLSVGFEAAKNDGDPA